MNFTNGKVILVLMVLFLVVQSIFLFKSNSAPVMTENDWYKPKESLEVAHYMSRIQNYHTKLFFSIQGENSDLIHFYLHEIREEMETIANAKIKNKQFDISENMKGFGLLQLDILENVLQDSLNVEKHTEAFELFTQSCNNCHDNSGFPFINIQLPLNNPFPNQNFSK